MKSPPARARAILSRRFADAGYDRDLYPELRNQLADYFAGRRVSFRVKTDLSGLSPFQKTVLKACVRIASGHTLTYGQLARQIGHPRAARAVGGALARNPIPLVIPCHRVIAGNGSLGGFSAEHGIALKRWLLKLEEP
ncbi:MAG: methylated-DNA--[protein]-cysteine S-methyltransferase [Phycisphaerales bacterium]|nr:methylated-DNA--[protein]-cysteine S-methyltransferase [Phycisphaerales bacterium]